MIDTAIRKLAIRAAIVLSFALASAGPSAQPDMEDDHAQHAGLMTPTPRTKVGLFAGDHVDVPHRQQEAPEGDHSRDDWPTDDFGQPLRGCDVPWDFVPLPRK